MKQHRASIYEIIFTIFCIAIGISVATYISPKNSYFFGNFIFYWLPQALVLAIIFIARYKFPIICGVALLLSVYLACFHLWVFSNSQPESMAWLGYIFSLPGAAIGALLSAPIVKYCEIKRSFMLGATALLITFVGLALNQVLICTTVMYCSI